MSRLKIKLFTLQNSENRFTCCMSDAVIFSSCLGKPKINRKTGINKNKANMLLNLFLTNSDIVNEKAIIIKKRIIKRFLKYHLFLDQNYFLENL